MTEINYKPRREIGMGYMRDTNCINAKHEIDDLNRIEEWYKNRVIDVILSSDSVDELKRYRAGDKEAAKQIRVEPEPGRGIPPEEIRAVVFPDGYTEDEKKRRNEEIDVWILASAKKHGRPLITTDGAILRKAKELAAIGIRVRSPADAVKEIADRIKARDEADRRMHEGFGTALPEWHGKD